MTASAAQRGIQSIEVGGRLLQALAHEGRALALKDLAAAADMPAAKAHAYLVSFGKLGLIEQDAASGRYGLGPLAMQLGLISLQQLDPLALATPLVETLAQTIGHTVAVAVWGNRGATIVRVAQPPSPVHVSMRHGTVMSLRGTASGRLFAALLPAAVVNPVLRAEARLESSRPAAARVIQVRAAGSLPGSLADEATQKAAGTSADKAAWAAACADIRRSGLSQVRDLLLPGISATAAPVFDGSGQLVLALTAIGPTAVFDGRPTGPVSQALRAAAQGLSKRLGAADSAPRGVA